MLRDAGIGNVNRHNTIHVVIFLPFVAFVFTYNSTATRTDLR